MSAARWIDPAALQPSVLRPPVSKSDAQRALVLAHVLGQPDPLAGVAAEEDLPNDIRVLIRGLAALRSGRPAEIDCADGGTPYRLLLGQAAVTPGVSARFRGTPRLGERPHGDLIAALRAALGPAGLVIGEGDPWPVDVSGVRDRAPVTVFRVRAKESSQFPSSLLLAAAALCVREGREWAVELDGPVASLGYLSLTVDWLRRVGFEVADDGARLTVNGHPGPGTMPAVPGDWSSIAYLLLLAWRTGGVVARVDVQAAHPDRAIVEVLRQAGLTLEARGDEVAVVGRPQGGVEASGATSPDVLPTVAALACVLPGPSVLVDAEILRSKESDRLDAIVGLVRAAGGEVGGDSRALRITPGVVPPELRIPTRGDHRIAMSAAVLAALSGSRVWIDDPACVGKSFPGFWAEAGRAGLALQE